MWRSRLANWGVSMLFASDGQVRRSGSGAPSNQRKGDFRLGISKWRRWGQKFGRRLREIRAQRRMTRRQSGMLNADPKPEDLRES